MSPMTGSVLHENEHATVALMTPRGRGAVATIRFVGELRLFDRKESALFGAANGVPLQDQPLNRLCFGYWGGQVREEVVVCRTDAVTVEIHCHGGDLAIRRILDDLGSAGCRIVSWQQLTQQSSSLFDSECLHALSQTTTFRTAEILLRQQSGLLRAALEGIRCSGVLIRTSRRPHSVEHDVASERPGCDPNESAEVAGAYTVSSADARTGFGAGGWQPVIQALDDLLQWADFGLHLAQPWKVVLAGRPNVGKSSLINALVGYSRSIVYAQPGTTRDVVTAETALDGWPIQLADTAGIRQATDRLESAGIQLAQREIEQADCRILMFDTSTIPGADDDRLLADWPDEIFVAHKCDLPDVWGTHKPTRAVGVSSVTREGIVMLAESIVARLVPEVPDPLTPIPITDRQVRLLKTARSAAKRNNASQVVRELEQCLS